MIISEAKILITGGGRGIGRKLVESLLLDNISIGILEIDKELINKLNEDFPSVKTWHCDVSKDESIEKAFLNMEKDQFEPNILINNAGIIYNEPLINITKKDNRLHSRETWKNVISVNLNSVFYITTRFSDLLTKKRKKGVVISISSISSQGNAGQAAYSVSKAGINILMKTASKELGPLGIRFISICPGFLNTDSTNSALSEYAIRTIKAKIPLRKLGEIESIYKAILAVIECDYMTGNIINIDGGLTI